MEQRLAESFETALGLADGIAVAEFVEKERQTKEPRRVTFSAKFACPVSGFTIPEIEPRLFSFNNPFGACPACDGLGEQLKIDPALVVPETDKSLSDGAIAPWGKSASPLQEQTLKALAKKYKFSLDTAWSKLPDKIRDLILNGTGEDEVDFVFDDGMRRYEVTKPFEGVVGNLERRFRETDSQWMREEIGRYQSAAPCPTCMGERLRPEALSVKINDFTISESAKLSIKVARDWFDGLPKKLTKKQNEIAVRILKEIRDRLQFLNDVGLDYLTLSRASGTLSGGESQRIRLASQIGSGLSGVLYVLDEPSIGLHQRDNERLLETLRRLRDLGNSVIVVEHDEDAILTADHVIDMGPRAGVLGGEVIASGQARRPDGEPARASPGKYLSGEEEIAIPEQAAAGPTRRRLIRVIGATGNNLKNVTAEIPLGVFTCVTGVSGGGKSTLIIETLYKALARRLNGASDALPPHQKIEGIEHLDKIIDIDQSPIGRTPRSNPATYTGAFGPIRDWYTGLPEVQGARLSGRPLLLQREGRPLRGLPGRRRRQDRDALPARRLRHLRRLQGQALQPRNARSALQGQVDRRRARHDGRRSPRLLRRGARHPRQDGNPRARRPGLREGRPAGDDAVGRRSPAREAGEGASKRATGRTMYILDEPTTGLHFDDVRTLLEVLQELVDAGNTIVVIEHNLDVIKVADWIIDMGPDGGDGGGEVVAIGTPEEVAKNKKSWTGKFLVQTFERQAEREARQKSKPKAAAAKANGKTKKTTRTAQAAE